MATDRDILPSWVKPTHYELALRDLNLTSFEFAGKVKVNLELKEATDAIKINAKELTLKKGSVTLEDGKTVSVGEILFDKKTEVATLPLSENLPASGKATLTIEYTGTANREMAGFYRSAYKDDAGNETWMFSTQFEACDARRAFPCFDEPNLKCTFDFSIEVPEKFTALSNMPEKSSESIGNGLKRVTFDTAPKMSTYLYAWACGEFEYVEAFTDHEYQGRGKLPVRVYTTPGLKEQARFALDSARKAVDYLSKIFEYEYPLPKVDMLAVHEFSHGAMENWGLITYRTTAVLFDEKTSDARYKVRVAYVVCHELTHQWSGNLVTMDWWSELWLNEGFATWVGWLATDYLHPEWDVWGQFVAEGMQTAFQLDALRGSHPIEVPVKNALEIDQIFDHISYLKGSSTIRMLSNYLGVETFLKGVAKYLNRHAYGNATTEDLWNALGEVAGVDVAAFMRDWVKVIGFPVLTVTEAPGEITVSQSRFLSTGDVKPEEDEHTWWVPLALSEESYTSSAEKIKALTVKETTIRNLNTNFYKLNHGQTGFFRVNYPAERLQKLGDATDKLSVADRIGLISDAAAMALAGYSSTEGLLGYITKLKEERSYFVWAAITEQLGKLRSLFGDISPEIKEGLRKLTLGLVSPLVQELGWDFKDGEDFHTARLRALLISTAGAIGHAGIISEAQRRFNLYISGEDKSAIHPNLRLAVFKIAVAEGGQPEVDAVMKEYLETTTVDGREICLVALGRARQPAQIQQVLELIISDKVKTQDKHTPAISLSNNSAARYMLWEFIQANWDVVRAQLSGNMVVLDRFLKNSLNKFADEKVLEEINAFFADKDNSGYDKGLGIIADSIRGNANYVKRDKEVLESWLKSKGFYGNSKIDITRVGKTWV